MVRSLNHRDRPLPGYRLAASANVAIASRDDVLNQAERGAGVNLQSDRGPLRVEDQPTLQAGNNIRNLTDSDREGGWRGFWLTTIGVSRRSLPETIMMIFYDM